MGARYLYTDDGRSFRAVDPDVTPGPGEAVFDFDPATEEQLRAAFPNRDARVKADDAKTAIGELERQQTPRRAREAALGTDGGWLAGLDKQIAQLRAKLKGA